MGKIVEVWDQGQLFVTGELVAILQGNNYSVVGVVQDSEGWMTTWPITSVKVLPDPPAPVAVP